VTIDQNTPLTAERLAETRDLNVDSCSADAPYNPDVWALEKARKDLLAAFDSLTETAHHQARMIAEITDACMAAEGDALRHRTQVAELSAEVVRLKAELDKAVAAAQNMAGAMAKVGPALTKARALAEAAAAVLGDVAPEGVEE
jgi:hypothetical protein